MSHQVLTAVLIRVIAVDLILCNYILSTKLTFYAFVAFVIFLESQQFTDIHGTYCRIAVDTLKYQV